MRVDSPWPNLGFSREAWLAARSLRRTPWYAATVAAITALSIALASTAFSVVDGVLFKTLPYPEPDELFAVSGRFEAGLESDRVVEMISPREVAAWSQTAPNVRLTSILYSSVVLPDGTFGDAAVVDRSFFDVFGVRLLAGGFRDEDYASRQAVEPIVISYGLWQERFDGDPTVIGRVLPPTDNYTSPMQIVGVLAMDGFVPPLPGRSAVSARRKNRVEVLRLPTVSSLGELSAERSYVAFARIPSAEVPEAQAALNRAAIAYREVSPPLPERISAVGRRARQPYDRVDLIPLRDFVSSRERPVFALVFGMAMSLVVLVLLNVGALAMARTQQRTRDLSVRRALGARTRDLLRHAMAEQAVLFAVGAVAGILASPMLLLVVLDRLPPGLNLVKDARVDWRVAAFAGLVSAAAAITVAILSVRGAVRQPTVTSALADIHGGSRARARVGRLLVAGQTAIAFALVLGGALFSASLVRLWNEDPGLRVKNVATMHLFYRDYQERSITQTWARVLDVAKILRSTPGVRGVALLDNSIMQNVQVPRSIFEPPASAVEGAPAPASVRISSGFFDSAGIALVEGRLPSDAELDTGAAVVAVSESVARAYWSGQNGRRQAAADYPPVWCSRRLHRRWHCA